MREAENMPFPDIGVVAVVVTTARASSVKLQR
jgi:hypothetical protein